jgi:hypothetical protein
VGETFSVAHANYFYDDVSFTLIGLFSVVGFDCYRHVYTTLNM